MTAQTSCVNFQRTGSLIGRGRLPEENTNCFQRHFEDRSCHVIQSTNSIVPNSISEGSLKKRLTEKVGDRRNSPEFKETPICTERTAVRQFSSFSITSTQTLKFEV